MTTKTTRPCEICDVCGRELTELDPLTQDETCDTPPTCCLDQIKAATYNTLKGGDLHDFQM